ncbi:MAG: serine hydrolase [Solirubrobacteraceae bacterium]
MAAPASGATAPSVSVTASAQHVRSGDPVTLSGQVTGAPGAGTVWLYASPYPYPVAAPSGSAVTSSTGSFTFTVHPDRDTRYRVLVSGSSARAVVQVDVAGRAITKVRSLPLGRAGVTIVVFHPRDLRWGQAPVRWSFASGAHGRFVAAPSSRTRRLSPYVVALRTTVTLPAGAFRFRACFDAPGDHALLNSRRPPGCTGRGYYGNGRLPVGFPSPGAVSRAASYLGTRTGRTAFAIIDSEGRLSGVRVHETFNTASVVKAMLLVAYLRRLDSMRQHHVDSNSNSFLYPMIHISDNAAATQCWSIVGDSGLYSVARAAAMTDFSVSGIWWNAQLSPADQARYFFEMDSLIPREFVGYARFLLSGIEASQSFGVPVVARPRGYRVYFKDGSEPTALGQLVHQVARLEGHGRTFSIAVMTDGDPSMGYGIDTIAGVTAALL